MSISKGTGIYAIVNRASSKIYVGSTGCSLKRRWSCHQSLLKSGRHYNRHLQAAWNKYGEEVFEFLVCEYVDSSTRLTEREQYWLDELRLTCAVYNASIIVGANRRGCKATEETRRRLRESHMGNTSAMGSKRTKGQRRRNGEAKAGPYPAFAHKKTGEIIPAGRNLNALCRKRGLYNANMHAVKNGHRHSHHGWVLLEQKEK